MVTPLLFLAAPIAAFFLSFTSHFFTAGPRYAVKVDYSDAQKGLTAKVIPPGEQAFTLLFTWPLPVPALRRGSCQQSAPGLPMSSVPWVATAGDPACAVLSFGGDQQVSSGDFQIQFPAAAAGTAIIRIA